MSSEPRLRYKFATEPWEFEAIHRLNYRTFVEEIPQHQPNAEERLVDRFHAENLYAICLHGDRVVGMVAGRTVRPFSLDARVPDLDAHLPAGRRPVEVRLLAVEKEYRSGVVFARLVGFLARHFSDVGYDLGLISGTTRQIRLYRHMGFTPFGPLTGTAEASYQPMYVTLEDFLRHSAGVVPAADAPLRPPVSFLPGPVEIHSTVRESFARPATSHRSERFLAELRDTQRMLCELTQAAHAQVVMGSGTLANEIVGAQLSLLGAPGVILANGEFGERLVDHAARLRLPHVVVRAAWGAPFEAEQVRDAIARCAGARWLWAVHCETSTGVLNDIAQLQDVAEAAGVRLALDCISSLGTLPLDLRRVALATGTSGKGPASFPGLGIVFHADVPPNAGLLPRYLDLGYIAAKDGVPFTLSTNLVQALQTALRREDWPAKFRRIAQGSATLRARLRAMGLQILAPDAHATPAVVTVVLPPAVSAAAIGRDLRAAGYLVSFNSEYLLARNWLQICLMGEWTAEGLEEVTALLGERAGLRVEDGSGPTAAAERRAAMG
jgi:aspartate aminotransferase-like enzyme/GNAT superfamily N-acetyltransferase